MDFLALSQQCAASVQPRTMQAIVRVESGFNPYAIGVVGGHLERQPRNLAEAVATAQALERDGWNFSLGMAQVNRYNLPKYKLGYEAAFDPCLNVRAGAAILKGCFDRARARSTSDRAAWQMAYSCYYSGNFKTGFKADFKGQPSYVNKVLASAAEPPVAMPLPLARPKAPRTVAPGARLAFPAQAGAAPGAGWDALGAREI